MRILRAIGYALGFVWSLPHTLLGVLLILVYFPREIRWSQGCLEVIPRWIIGSPGAQTHGVVIFYRDRRTRAWVPLRVHERVHVVQGMIFGIFYIISYSLFFLLKWVSQGFRHWAVAYMWIPWEKQAYRIQKEYMDGERKRPWGSWPRET